MRNLTSRIALASAATLTLISLGLTASAAAERGATVGDQALIVGVSLAITLGAHLLPALTRRPAGWALWAACVVLTLYGHAVFFHAAGARAGQQRAQAVQPGAQAAALREQLQHSTARSPAAVGADLASAQGRAAAARLALQRCEKSTPGRCAALAACVDQVNAAVQALRTEADEAAHTAQIRQQLTTAAGQLDTQRQAAALDPIAARVAALTQTPPESMALLVSIVSAAVLDLLATLLWTEALRRAPAAPGTSRTPVPHIATTLAERIAATVAPPAPPVPPARRMQPQSTAPPAVRAFRRPNDNHPSGATP